MSHVEHQGCIVHIANTGLFLGNITGQANYLLDHGFEIQAIAPPGPGLLKFGLREGVPVHPVEMSRKITPLRDLLTVYRLWKLLRKLRPTIVQAHTPKGGIVGMIAAWLAGVPVRIYHLHGLPRMTASRPYQLLLRWAGRLTGRLAHRVICVSESARRAALDQQLCSPGKARVLGSGSVNGLDSAYRFNPTLIGGDTGRRLRAALCIPSDARVLGYVGRIVADKGIGELTQAWGELRQRHPDAHLIVVGPFESIDPVPVEVRKELAGDRRVHLIADWIEDIPPYYAAMDLLVLPSYREGLGSVLLEAAAMGLPVVATAVPGCVDAVQDGITGMLVPPRDARALAEAIAMYLDDIGLRQAHGRAGRERIVREFDQRQVWAAMLGEYRELLDTRFGSNRRADASPGNSEDRERIGRCSGMV